MESVRTKSRKPRRPSQLQKSQPKQRRTDPAAIMPPAPHPPLEDGSSKTEFKFKPATSPQPTPHFAADWPSIPYELMLAIPIRRRCFAIRRYLGLTNWSSFHLHRSPLQQGDPSSGKVPDPFT